MKNLKADGTFLGYIIDSESKKVPICLPFGEYKIKRLLKRYVELHLKVYHTVNGISKEYFARIKRDEVSDIIDKPYFYPVNLYRKENFNNTNGISLLEYNPDDYKGNYTEIMNEAFAFFDGLERLEMESGFSTVGTIYWWEDKESGDTIYDGIEGCSYNGEAPPYENMSWLMGIHTKIDSLRSATGKKPCIVISGNVCGIIYRAIPGKLYSVNDCKVIHSKSTLMESLYSAMANFVKKYPTPDLYI